jgi:hypothetical protein
MTEQRPELTQFRVTIKMTQEQRYMLYAETESAIREAFEQRPDEMPTRGVEFGPLIESRGLKLEILTIEKA